MKEKSIPNWVKVISSFIIFGAVLLIPPHFLHAEEALAENHPGRPDTEAEIKELMTGRTEAMNEYFAGKIPYSLAAEKLQAFESELLLAEDLESLRIFKNTDIDSVEGFQILDVQVTDDFEEVVYAEVTVLWQVNGLGGKDTFTVTYRVKCRKQAKTLKLVQFF